MKKLFLNLFFFLVCIVTKAQTEIQPSTAPISEPEKSNSWDVIAIIAGSITLSGLACYLIYLLISNKRNAMKRKLQ